MKRNPATQTWSLRDNQAQHRVDGLSLNEVLIILKSIAPSRLGFWEARRSNDSKWCELWEYDEFELSSPPPVQQPKPVRTAALDDESTLEIDLKGLKDRRSQRRYRKAFTFVVHQKNLNFESHTQTISLDSLAISRELPLAVKDPFYAVLIRGDEQVQVKLKRSGRKDHKSFEILAADPVELLREWLLKW